jgi:hypothetical protein
MSDHDDRQLIEQGVVVLEQLFGEQFEPEDVTG